ncbi:MAG: HAD-IIA family hydrolase [Tannerella sp.]|jgi:NagD protein|nr:HAD-IIA family hydrolase [Tannerella sp.]
MDILEKLKRIKHVALDMDGTIYKGSRLFPFTVSFLEGLKQLGITYSFLTNNPSRSTDEYVNHLRQMGISSMPEEIYTSAQATVEYIKINYPEVKKLFLLGTSGMTGEFEADGFVSVDDTPNDSPDMVVVGFDRTLTYSRLCRACWWIGKGLPYIATNPDRICPTNLPTVLVDCGSICACIEQAVGRKPDVVVGKPDPRMLAGILKCYGLVPDEVAIVGDRLYTDIAMAKNTRSLGVLVLTGETQAEDLQKCNILPDMTVKDISVFGRLLAEAKQKN